MSQRRAEQPLHGFNPNVFMPADFDIEPLLPTCYKPHDLS
jgi:hypothetical protein